LGYKTGKWGTHTTAIFHAKAISYARTSDPRLDDFIIINLNGFYQIADNVRLQADIGNILDTQYSTAHGNGFSYNQPGRNGTMSLRVTF